MGQPRAALLDIDGVLTVSWEPLPGAAAAVGRLRRAGWPVAFLTNTTSQTRAAVVDKLRHAGITVDEAEVLTAVRAAAGYLAEHHPGDRCLLLNEGAVAEDLAGINLVGSDDTGPTNTGPTNTGPTKTGPVDVVLTGGAGPAITYELLDRAFRALLDGAAFVAMHRNLDWRTAGGLQLDMGAFIVGLEQATGTEATVVGKPAPDFFGAALAQLGVGREEAVMVGDDLEADVLGAQACGIDGVLVRTGKFRPDALDRSPGRPTHVIDSVADLPDLLGLPNG